MTSRLDILLYFSLPFLQATPSYPSWTLEGLFELTWGPSRALVGGPRTPSRTIHVNPDCAFEENTLFFLFLPPLTTLSIYLAAFQSNAKAQSIGVKKSP